MGGCGPQRQGQRPGVGKDGYVNGGVGRAWGRRAREVLGILAQTRRGGVVRAHAARDADEDARRCCSHVVARTCGGWSDGEAAPARARARKRGSGRRGCE